MNYLSHQDFKAKSVIVSRTYSAIAARLTRNEDDKRALLAAALTNGDPIPRLSERAAAKATKVSRHKVRLAKLATAGDVELVRMGRLRLSDVHRMRAKSRPMSDAQIENFIDRADPVRILAYLDRLTLAIAAE
jgi:hypothetical protein